MEQVWYLFLLHLALMIHSCISICKRVAGVVQANNCIAITELKNVGEGK